MAKQKRPPESEEHSRFKDLLRRLVAVPKKEADEKVADFRDKRAKPQPET
jgi:hypothetical protein